VSATWLVVRSDDGDGPWMIRRDGVVVETLRGHYDAWEALSAAQLQAGASLVWRLTDDGGFQATSGGAS
jgi:hypothetical protein